MNNHCVSTLVVNYFALPLHTHNIQDGIEEEQSQATVVPALPPLPPEQLDTAVQVCMCVTAVLMSQVVQYHTV